MARFNALVVPCVAVLLLCVVAPTLVGAAFDDDNSAGSCSSRTSCKTCLNPCESSFWSCSTTCMWCDSSSSCVTRPSGVSTSSGSYSNAGETCYTKYEKSGTKQCGFDPDPVAVLLCTVCPLIGVAMFSSVWCVIKSKLRGIAGNRPAINAALEAELKQDLASSNETADWQGFGYPEKYANLCGLWFLLIPMALQVVPSLVWWLAVGLPDFAGFALFMSVLMPFGMGTLFMSVCLCGVCSAVNNNLGADIYALTATKAIIISVDPSTRRRKAAKYYPFTAMNTLQVKDRNLWFQRTVTFVNTSKGMRQRIQMVGFQNIEDTSTPFSLLQPKVNTAAVNMTPMNAMFGTQLQQPNAVSLGGGAGVAAQPTVQTNAALQAQLLAQQQQIAQLMAMQQAQMAGGGATAVPVVQPAGVPTTTGMATGVPQAAPAYTQPSSAPTMPPASNDGKGFML